MLLFSRRLFLINVPSEVAVNACLILAFLLFSLQTMQVENVELNPGQDDTQRQTVLKTVRTAAQLMQARSPNRRYDLSEK